MTSLLRKLASGLNTLADMLEGHRADNVGRAAAARTSVVTWRDAMDPTSIEYKVADQLARLLAYAYPGSSVWGESARPYRSLSERQVRFGTVSITCSVSNDYAAYWVQVWCGECVIMRWALTNDRTVPEVFGQRDVIEALLPALTSLANQVCANPLHLTRSQAAQKAHARILDGITTPAPRRAFA